MEPVKKRKSYPSTAQKMRLAQLVQADDDLFCGNFSTRIMKNKAQAKWIVLSLKLNSIPGAHKSWFEWRKTWHDMKNNTRKKTALYQAFNGTGEGSPRDSLSEDDITQETTSPTELEEHADIGESVVYIKDNQEEEEEKEEKEEEEEVKLDIHSTQEGDVPYWVKEVENRRLVIEERTATALEKVADGITSISASMDRMSRAMVSLVGSMKLFENSFM